MKKYSYYFFKVIEIVMIGLLISIVIYPTLHELGHIVSATLLDVEIVGIKLIHPAYVIINTLEINEIEYIIIGISGNIFPTLIILIAFAIESITKTSKFWDITEVWYSKTFILFCCTLSYIISCLNIALYNISGKVFNEDISMIISEYPHNQLKVALIMLLIGTLCLIVLFRNKCIKTFINHLNNIYDRSVANEN